MGTRKFHAKSFIVVRTNKLTKVKDVNNHGHHEDSIDDLNHQRKGLSRRATGIESDGSDNAQNHTSEEHVKQAPSCSAVKLDLILGGEAARKQEVRLARID